jgi:hypothetical protein
MNNLQDIETRVRRLEQLHIWGATVLALVLGYYLLKRSGKL